MAGLLLAQNMVRWSANQFICTQGIGQGIILAQLLGMHQWVLLPPGCGCLAIHCYWRKLNHCQMEHNQLKGIILENIYSLSQLKCKILYTTQNSLVINQHKSLQEGPSPVCKAARFG